jgi:hypothetical protein
MLFYLCLLILESGFVIFVMSFVISRVSGFIIDAHMTGKSRNHFFFIIRFWNISFMMLFLIKIFLRIRCCCFRLFCFSTEFYVVQFIYDALSDVLMPKFITYIRSKTTHSTMDNIVEESTTCFQQFVRATGTWWSQYI